MGFFISTLESLCTGQVYLPTIVLMTRVPGNMLPKRLALAKFGMAGLFAGLGMLTCRAMWRE